MATKDAINAAIAQLQALAAPSPQITTLLQQRSNLVAQIIAIDAQILALQTPDAQLAQTALEAIRVAIPNRTQGALQIQPDGTVA